MDPCSTLKKVSLKIRQQAQQRQFLPTTYWPEKQIQKRWRWMEEPGVALGHPTLLEITVNFRQDSLKSVHVGSHAILLGERQLTKLPPETQAQGVRC